MSGKKNHKKWGKTNPRKRTCFCGFPILSFRENHEYPPSDSGVSYDHGNEPKLQHLHARGTAVFRWQTYRCAVYSWL